LALALVACNSEKPATGSTGTTGTTTATGKKLKIGLVFDSGGRGDKSFNDSAYRGLERAVKELGVEEKTVDSAKEADYEGNIDALAEQGVDLIFGVGISMKTALENIAPKYPNMKFAIVDAPVELPNVRSLVFKEEEGSFLAGYLAGLMTKTNKLGFVGGMEIDLIKKFLAGYEAGAKSANPAVEVLPAKYTGDWANQDLGKQSAKTLYGQGADIVFHASGKCGLGVIEAAREEGKYAIGVDSDQDHLAEGRVLTSMIKRVDEAVFQTIKDLHDNKWDAGTKMYDLKASGVGLSDMTFTKDKIGAENLKKVDEQKAKIIAGEFKVPATPDELTAFLAALKKS
jgi:basic membrane protein A